MTVALLTSRHIPEDDRLFHHLAVTLAGAGHDAVMISSRGEEEVKKKGVRIRAFDGSSMHRRERKERFIRILGETAPAAVLCADPFSVHAAYTYRKRSGGKVRILYDITEWYPSKKELSRHALFLRPLLFPVYLLYNLQAAARSDAFLFGEWYKSRPYRIFFPRREHLSLPYYPDLRYIPYTEPSFSGKMLRLTYNGKLSREKGFGRFLDVVRMLAERRPALVIRVKVIGWYADEREKKILEKKQADMPGRVRITHHPFLEYHEFLQMIRDIDLFFDLRRGDPENQRCLPIRIFLYAALGRPVIFTNLKALRREVETARFGRLVNPRDTAAVVRLVEEYLDDRQLYLAHCREARRLAEERYNWSAVSGHFITFLEKTTVS